MFNLKLYKRKLDEIEAIRRGQLIEFLAQERKRELAASKRRNQTKVGGRKRSRTSPSP